MRLYSIVKMFVLPFMLGVYVMFLMTIAAAHYAGGWVVVLVDKYREGLTELILLASVLPPATYVTFRETAVAYRELRSDKHL